MIKLKTSFEFDSAHRLVGYEGKCSNLHGHIWHCDIEIEGDLMNDLNEVGILWDFTNVKKIKDLFDHKTILKDCDENRELISSILSTCGKDSVYLMIHNPTAEWIAVGIIDLLETQNNDLKYKVTVFESPKSSCEVQG